jgi:hypothetical protein
MSFSRILGSCLLGLLFVSTACSKKLQKKTPEYPVYSSAQVKEDGDKLTKLTGEFSSENKDLRKRVDQARALSQAQLERIRASAKDYDSFLQSYLGKYRNYYKLDDKNSDRVYRLENPQLVEGLANSAQSLMVWIDEFLSQDTKRRALKYELSQRVGPTMRFYTARSFLARDNVDEVLQGSNRGIILGYQAPDQTQLVDDALANTLFGENKRFWELDVRLTRVSHEDDVVMLGTSARNPSQPEKHDRDVLMLGMEQTLENTIKSSVTELRNMKLFISEEPLNRYENESFRNKKDFMYYIVVAVEPRTPGQAGYVFALDALTAEGQKAFLRGNVDLYRVQ